MEKIFEKLFDLKKIPAKLIMVVLFSAGILLFVPEDFLTKLNLKEFTSEYGKYLGISFIISSGLILVSIFTSIGNAFARHRRKIEIERSIERSVKNLDFHEKALLREFFIHSKSTLQLPIDNDTVTGLSNKGIIYKASGIGFTYVYGAYWAFSITEFASKLITADILGFPRNPTEAEKRKIINERPQWAVEKDRFSNF